MKNLIFARNLPQKLLLQTKFMKNYNVLLFSNISHKNQGTRPLKSKRNLLDWPYFILPATKNQYYGTDQSPGKLHLMNFPLLTWPNFWKAIKNQVYTYFIIKPHLDPEFNLQKFLEGAEIAAEVFSHKLSEGKFSDLVGLATDECLEEVKKSFARLNVQQMQDLAIRKSDMYFSFAYEVGVIFKERKDAGASGQERFVEITVVCHAFKGLKEMEERGDPIPLNIGMKPEYREKVFILNYRFIRNYTKGVSDQWTINVANHFKPIEQAAM